MYNREQKEDFLKYFQRDKAAGGISKVYEATFNKFEPHEEAWGADLCTRSKEELQQIVDEFVGVRKISALGRVLMLREYGKWCLIRGIDGACDGIVNIEPPKTYDAIKKTTVKSPAHLKAWLTTFMGEDGDAVEREGVLNTIRCYFWLAFGGVPHLEVFDVQTGDVLFDEQIIKTKSGEADLYKEGLTSIRNCVTMREFLVANKREADFRSRAAGNQLIRGVRSEATANNIRVAIKRRMDEMLKDESRLPDGLRDVRLTYDTVWLSGVFYRTYQMEELGFSPVFDDVATLLFDGKHAGEENVEKKTRKIRIYQMKRALGENYSIWKETFY